MSQRTSSSIQVQGTNDNSIVSKLSMINLGYEEDKYLNVFVKKPQRRSPLINRGYYLRCKAVRHAVNTFLGAIEGRKQVISLGAGFDTTYFVVNKDVKNRTEMMFVEIDYPGVLNTKMCLGEQHGLFSKTKPSTASQVIFRQDNYLAVGFDLRHVGSQLTGILEQNGVDLGLPTLFLSEVVLTYLTGIQSSRVLSWINHCCKNAFILVFEQMMPSDGFGNVMCRHFQNLGSPLLSIDHYPSLESQKKRHNDLGFHDCSVIELQRFYDNLPQTERRRIEGLEWFDEYEGWNQMCQHYFLLCSTNSTIPTLTNLCQEMTGSNAAVPSKTSDHNEKNSPPQSSTCVESMSNSLQLFGHSMTMDNENGQAFIFGGFGIPFSLDRCKQSSHQRLLAVYKVDLQSYEVSECLSRDQPNFPMFSSVVLHKTPRCCLLVMFGGRTSPKHSTNRVDCFEISSSSKQETTLLRTATTDSPEVAKPSHSTPCGRWRHASTLVAGCTSTTPPQMIVIGGRDATKVFSDCWSLDMESFTWKKLCLKSHNFEQNDEFPARHSHSSSSWISHDAVIVSGGMDEDSNAFNDVLCVKIFGESEATYERLRITPPLIPRYSHTSHVVKEELLLLVGGVVFPPASKHYSDDLALQDHVAVINLMTSSWVQTIMFPVVHLGKPLRVHCHTSAVKSGKADDEFELSVFGGGSNCFSFGTSFNQSPLRFTLRLVT